MTSLNSPMRQLKILLMVVLCFGLCGCYVLSKMDELSTLGNYTRDKEEQQRIINRVDARYDALLAAVNTGAIKQYSDQRSVRKAFGDPIVIKVAGVAGHKQERWLYRYALPLKARDKVYLYFDGKGKLVQYKQEKIQW